MPTYPQASPAISVQALLKQPQRISRDLANMVYQRLITPKLFVRGTKEQVAGGAMQYQLAESIFLDTLPGRRRDRDPRRLAARRLDGGSSRRPVKQYGLEVPLSNLAIRRNAIDQLTRAERKLANNIVRFVDTQRSRCSRPTPASRRRRRPQRGRSPAPTSSPRSRRRRSRSRRRTTATTASTARRSS
jgi:hypothetical protein